MGNVARNVLGRSHIVGRFDIELFNGKSENIFATLTRYKLSGIKFNKEKFFYY